MLILMTSCYAVIQDGWTDRLNLLTLLKCFSQATVSQPGLAVGLFAIQGWRRAQIYHYSCKHRLPTLCLGINKWQKEQIEDYKDPSVPAMSCSAAGPGF